MSETVLWIDVIATTIAAAAAIAAFMSAAASKRAAQETHRATQAQLISQFRTAYASPEMLEAIDSVKRWAGEIITRGSPLDNARRQVSQHFQTIDQLARRGLLDDELVKAVATSDQVALFCHVIEKMEAQENPGYDLAPFDNLSRIYGGRLHLPYLPPRSASTGKDGAA